MFYDVQIETTNNFKKSNR